MWRAFLEFIFPDASVLLVIFKCTYDFAAIYLIDFFSAYICPLIPREKWFFYSLTCFFFLPVAGRKHCGNTATRNTHRVGEFTVSAVLFCLPWQNKAVKCENNLRWSFTKNLKTYAVLFAFVQAMESHAFHHVLDDERCPQYLVPGPHKLQQCAEAFSKERANI